MVNLKYSTLINVNLLISSIIFFLIIGSFLSDLIVSISSLFFLYHVFNTKDYFYFNNTTLIIFFLFCLVCIFCSLFAEDILFSLKSSLFYFRVGIFSCLIWYLIDKDKNILNYFYYFLIICFSGLIIDGYYQFFNEENIFGFKKNNMRLSSFFGDELILGSYLSRLFPLLFALFLVKNKKNYEIYFIGLLFILTDILIFMSGERTSFFFLNLSTIFIIILIKEYQKFRLVTFIIAFICILIVSLNSSSLTNRMITTPAKNMGLIKNSVAPTIFTPIHDSHIRTSFKMFLDKPFIGHGPKMFRVKCSDTKYAVGKWHCSTHPHNFYVQLLAETGIVGFTFLFSVFCYVIYCAFRQLISITLNKKRYLTDYQVCLLAGILISVWPFSPNGNFFNNWLTIIYTLPVGFYLHSFYGKNKKLVS